MLSLAISPCPNDTFIFHALIHGLVPDGPELAVTYADVDVTNEAAQRGEFDLVKVSYAVLPHLISSYELLECGGALGRGCGPLVVTRSRLESLSGRSVAVPGEQTTAYLLLRLWANQQPPASVHVVPFAKIMPAVLAGHYDAGLVIHEARFTYPRYGLRLMADLGQWWESETGLPIPLGAIVARRGAVDAAEATGWIRESLRQAWADPAAGREFVLAHAQELEPDVVQQHIDLYVNEYTHDLGETGRAAVQELLRRGAPLHRP